MIDLRTDTLTRPTAAMREAIARAEVGDEQKREDPTVIALEERVAELLGQEDAVYVPSATMANQIALRVLAEPGDGLVAHAASHLVRSEAGGPAALAGLMVEQAGARDGDGRFGAEELRALATVDADRTQSTTRVVSVENTHSNCGGRVWTLAQTRAVLDEARAHGIRAHLDGARIMNASVALGVPAAELAGGFDTVTICFSKGLGCPFGAALAAEGSLVQRARRVKQLLGGAMRQAGMMAASALYALDHHVERLADDHRRARALAGLLSDAGAPVDLAQVETNFVLIDAGARGLSGQQCIARIAEEGVLVSATARRDVVRAVTHLDVDDDDIDQAAAAIARALPG